MGDLAVVRQDTAGHARVVDGTLAIGVQDHLILCILVNALDDV